MARPLRINRADGWYHVYSRGVNRQEIFADAHDSSHFLELLGKSVERHRIVIHAYVLMVNHYHLIVQTPDANLSRAMQWLNQSYANWYVVRHQRTGQVFQRPFGSRTIENAAWALELSEYVHLNPLRIAAFSLSRQSRKASSGPLWRSPSREQVTSRLKKLRTFRWSSYRAYGGYAQPPKWLETAELLKLLPGSNRSEKKASYRKRLRSRLKEGVDEERKERLADAVCVGSAGFMTRTKDLVSRGGVGREHSGKQAVRNRVGIEDVKEAVSRAKGEDWEDYGSRHGDYGKAVVMLLARTYTGLRLGEIGEALGGRDYAAVCMMIRHFEKRLETDKSARKLLADAEQILYLKM